MDSKIPVSILLERAAQNVEQAVLAAMDELKISSDLMDFVLCRVRCDVLQDKALAYARTYRTAEEPDKPKEEIVKKSGTVEELVQDMQEHGVQVKKGDE